MPMTAANIPRGIDAYTRALLIKTITKRAAQLRAPGPRYFPDFLHGISTASYVRTYHRLNPLGACGGSSYIDLSCHEDHAAPYLLPHEDHVTVETEPDVHTLDLLAA